MVVALSAGGLRTQSGSSPPPVVAHPVSAETSTRAPSVKHLLNWVLTISQRLFISHQTSIDLAKIIHCFFIREIVQQVLINLVRRHGIGDASCRLERH